MKNTWKLSFIAASFSFLQWTIYFSILSEYKQEWSGHFLLNLVAFLFVPLSIFPMLSIFSRKLSMYSFDRKSIYLGLFLTFLFQLSYFLKGFRFRKEVFFIEMFQSSLILGMVVNKLSALIAHNSPDGATLRSDQAKLSAGYYLGIFISMLVFSLAFILDSVQLGAMFSVGFFVISVFYYPKNHTKLLLRKNPQTGLTKAPWHLRGFRYFLSGQLLRYTSWGLLSFMFPIAALKLLHLPIAVYSRVAACSIGLMMLTSFYLSSVRLGRSVWSDRAWSVSGNLINGLAIFMAYYKVDNTNSKLMFFVCYFVASVISIIADIKTLAGFLPSLPQNERASATTWSLFIRYGSVALGNLVAYLYSDSRWNTLSTAILVLFTLSSVMYMFTGWDKKALKEMAS